MEVLQTFKDESGIKSTILDRRRGILYTASQFIKQWVAKVEPEIELKVLEMIEASPEINNTELVSQDNIKETRNSNVLVTGDSNLVFMGFIEQQNLIVTVDSKSLVRLWDLATGESKTLYNIDIDGVITAANIDKTNGLIVIGNEFGVVKIFNVYSGGLLYELPEAPSELTELKFVKAITDISLVGTCWDGKVMMWTQPNEDRNYQIDGICSIGHRDDIICIDSDEKYIATGASDGLVSVWSILSGMMIYSFPVPTSEENKDPTVKNSIVALKLVRTASNILYI
jgi:WD40 repeat protein